MGTLIRHARPAGPALPIISLPIAMIESFFRAPLVAAVGAATLLQPGLSAASGTAIAVMTCDDAIGSEFSAKVRKARVGTIHPWYCRAV